MEVKVLWGTQSPMTPTAAAQRRQTARRCADRHSCSQSERGRTTLSTTRSWRNYCSSHTASTQTSSSI